MLFSRKWVPLLLPLAFLLISCRGVNPGAATPTPVPTPIVLEKPTYTVQVGTVSKQLELTGRVVPVRQQDLFFRSDGIVRTAYFGRGDFVQAGDVLADLEKVSDLERQHAAAQLALQRAQINLENAHYELALYQINAPSPETRQAQAELNVVEAKLALLEAQRAFQSASSPADQATIDAAYAQMLLAQDALQRAQKRFAPYANKPEDNLTRAQLISQLSAAQQAYDAAARKYNALANPGSAARQALARAKLQLAQAQLAQAQEELEQITKDPNALGYAEELGLKQNQVELAQIAVEEASLRLSELEDALADAQIIAPFDSQILSLGLAPGSQATAYRAVITLGDPSELEIVTIPSPEEARQISVGQAVTFQLTNRPGETWTGHVRSLPLLSGNLSEGNDQAANDPSLRITVDDPELTLTLGETVSIVIPIATRENVLWLPPAAIRTFQGSDFVLVQNGDIQQRVNVRIGLRSADRVEILEGLSEGQVVVGP